ncbi:Metallo-dependent phosphatase-like protein [Hypomontagnella submonticulosa]|nr:Metallo-dependent phosphatase-like protein [Hypomontagnella submonticulosa]
MHLLKYIPAIGVAFLVRTSLACSSCYGPTNHVEHVRHVKRMQPDAINATYGPTRALEWGQLNFLHTTDTHGWLEGHLKEGSYGADWGDFVTFTTRFKHQAGNMGVDLLVVDTGDLHDGAGLSDATTPDGEISMKVFDKVDYDLLTIGNHELYLADVAYQALDEISTYWGDKYLTSNVQVLNRQTKEWQYIGKTHRYFTTQHGLRVMAFGVLFDFTGNTNVSKVIPAKTMVTQQWFLDAINTVEPVDVFVVLGHNPARASDRTSTFPIVFNAIRAVHPDTPIQFLGGHSHIRDFAVFDSSSTSLESGRYCETLGWLSMSGFASDNSGYVGIQPGPAGVPNPTRKARQNSTSPFVYSRRYLDWNRRTFEYHAATWYDHSFDYNSGLAVTAEVTKYREQLKLGQVYGCVPRDYCMTCAPFNSSGSIFPVLSDALGVAVVNESRQDIPRYIIANTGSVRFDMYKGPFTYDDTFIVSPFLDVFLYIPEVPYDLASKLLDLLNNAGASQKRNIGTIPVERDICVDPLPTRFGVKRGEHHGAPKITRRQVVDLVPGYTTKDDFGTDGDDTAHSAIPYYEIPDFFQGTGGFGDGGVADAVDLVFVDFIESDVLAILGSNYSSGDVSPYIDANFTTQDYLPLYVTKSGAFQAGLPNCTVA